MDNLHKLAAGPPGGGNPFGPITVPPGVVNFSGGAVGGLGAFISVLIKTLILLSAIYAVFNFVLAGYWYISGAGEPKRIADATAKIWQTVIGLAVAAGSLVIAGVIGQLIFKDPTALLKIQIFTP